MLKQKSTKKKRRRKNRHPKKKTHGSKKKIFGSKKIRDLQKKNSLCKKTRPGIYENIARVFMTMAGHWSLKHYVFVFCILRECSVDHWVEFYTTTHRPWWDLSGVVIVLTLRLFSKTIAVNLGIHYLWFCRTRWPGCQFLILLKSSKSVIATFSYLCFSPYTTITTTTTTTTTTTRTTQLLYPFQIFTVPGVLSMRLTKVNDTHEGGAPYAELDQY